MDPEERRPCPDDMCTGILSVEGRCGTCGREGDPLPVDAAPRAPTGDEATADTPSADEAPAHAASGDDDPVAPGGDDDRVPCRDEMCTGVVGADGRCGTCGASG